MNAQAPIHKIRDAGLTLVPDGDRLLVSPEEQLTPERLSLLREHKLERLAALRNPGSLLDADGGHDLAAANCPLSARLAIAAERVCREVHGDSDGQVQAMLDDLASHPPKDWDALTQHFEAQLSPPPEPGRKRITVQAAGSQSNMAILTNNVAAFKARASVRFTLKDNDGGGSLLGEPGKTEDELREILREKYSDRLESINGTAP